MLRIGLTGGVASGKSTVARMFSELGVEVVDTDAIARDIVAPGSPALAAIIEHFGRDIVDEAGELDRRAMRRIVFSDAQKRRKLEEILHPLIRRRALALAEQARSPYVILAVPLLFETGFDALVARNLVVDCTEQQQLERLKARDGVGDEEAGNVLAAQLRRDRRLALADDVIDNAGTVAESRRQVARLHEKYLGLARNCPTVEGRAE